MPELRKDPIIGRWVIISTERKKRPSDFQEQREEKRKRGFCPFCPGNEHTTPPEVLAFRNDTQPNSPGWRLRVVPNKFPALQMEGDFNKTGDGIFDRMNGIGTHEVIIESPLHEGTLSNLSVDVIEDVLWAYQKRMVDLRNDPRFQYVLIFKNEGSAAGATLEHSHSQLIALPIVPKLVKEEIDGAKQHYDLKERCIFCDIISQEMEARVRIISENKGYVALAPFAPRSPFETWILPKRHDSCFECIPGEAYEDKYKDLAQILHLALRQIDKVLSNPPYNYIIHTSPFSDPHNEFYHWHIEIVPKLTMMAGFEFGSGFYINPTSPEEAARFLREAKIEPL